MALKCGIVGLPNVGKSTLFNCLSNAKAQSANFPFCTIEPNIGVITVPDDRLIMLEELVKPQRVVPTTVEIVDIAGLVRGASKGEGLGNKFLGNIRETDAIIHVLRCFENENITHVDTTINPVRDKETIDIELQLKDLEADAKLARELQLLTNKPILYICNVDEAAVVKGNDHVEALKEAIKDENAEMLMIAAATEADIAELDDFEERQLFLEDLGLKESGVNKLIKLAYKLLQLETYFTAGVKEVRAWTYKRGFKAPQAAGVIHTDFEKGFIRAEVIKYNDFVALGSEQACKEAGKMAIEGKDYVVQDGDIMHFRFNV